MEGKTIRWGGVRDVFWRPCGAYRSLSDAVARRGVDDSGPILKYVDLPLAPGAPTGVALLKQGKVIGDARLVALSDDAVIGNLQFLFGTDGEADHWMLRQRRPRWPSRVEGDAAIIAASNGDNYYHWLFDALPRIELLEMAGVDVRSLAHVVLNREVRAFQAQSLERLGIRTEQFLRSGKREVTSYERLWVPSMPGPPGRPPAWICEFLRRRLGSGWRDTPRRRLYVSRRHAAGRRVVNEAEILPVLERHAIEVVHAETLSFADQVELFSSASLVLAVHGAGMSNTVFCAPGTRVLEMRSPMHFNECFSTIAAGGGLEYRSIVLQPAVGDGAAGPDRFGDLRADPIGLEQELEQLG